MADPKASVLGPAGPGAPVAPVGLPSAGTPGAPADPPPPGTTRLFSPVMTGIGGGLMVLGAVSLGVGAGVYVNNEKSVVTDIVRSIHGADTVEEKLSLSDRFGLVISFYSPDQDTFLRMVENWAKVEGIKTSPAELRAKAIQWEKANNVRSGRTARQFINDLMGRV